MIEILATCVIIVIIFLVLFWLKKTLFLVGFFFKLFLLCMLLLVVGSIFFGYLVVKDASDFKNNFSNSTSMVIVKQTTNGTETFLAGATINPEQKKYDPMSKKQLANAQQLYNDDKMSTLGADYYKVFIIELKSFDDIKLYNISDQNVELNKEEIKTIMLSDDAKEDLARIVAKKNGMKTNDVYKDISATDEEIKAYILSYYLSTVFDTNNIANLVSQLKSGNIEVYSNTALFKAIKLVPNSLVNKLVKESVGNSSINSTANSSS
jgi:hypothetical protein